MRHPSCGHCGRTRGRGRPLRAAATLGSDFSFVYCSAVRHSTSSQRPLAQSNETGLPGPCRLARRRQRQRTITGRPGALPGASCPRRCTAAAALPVRCRRRCSVGAAASCSCGAQVSPCRLHPPPPCQHPAAAAAAALVLPLLAQQRGVRGLTHMCT